MELLNALDVADIFRLKGSDKEKHRKILNWLNNGVLPRSVTIKMGRDILFVREKIEQFIEEKTGV